MSKKHALFFFYFAGPWHTRNNVQAGSRWAFVSTFSPCLRDYALVQSFSLLGEDQAGVLSITAAWTSLSAPRNTAMTHDAAKIQNPPIRIRGLWYDRMPRRHMFLLLRKQRRAGWLLVQENRWNVRIPRAKRQHTCTITSEDNPGLKSLWCIRYLIFC